MTDCQSVKESLVLLAERELTPAERKPVEDHLAECPRCREEFAKIETVRTWLADSDLFMPSNYAWHFLPRSLAARAKEISPAKTWLPLNFGSMGWAASLAATLIVSYGLIWMLYRQASLPMRATTSVVRGNEDFLRQMQTAYARGATAQYLTECQDLLLNVIRAEKGCQGEKYDVSVEISRARVLLQRKRMLDNELRSPEVVRAKELCDELENFLVDLSTSERCESADKLQTLERVIQREQLLLRINLLQSELS